MIIEILISHNINAASVSISLAFIDLFVMSPTYIAIHFLKEKVTFIYFYSRIQLCN